MRFVNNDEIVARYFEYQEKFDKVQGLLMENVLEVNPEELDAKTKLALESMEGILNSENVVIDDELRKFNLVKLGINVIDKITVEEWANSWLKTYKATASYNTYQVYSVSIKNHINPAIGKTLISNVKTIQIQELLNSIIESGRIRTAEICKQTIKQFMKQAYIEGLINRDVTLGIQAIKSKTPEKRALSRYELHAIKDSDLSLKQRTFLNIMLYAGLRRGEALAITTNNIDIANRTIEVKNSLFFEENTPVLKEPKTKSGIRKIPIPDELFQNLLAYIPTLTDEKLFTMNNGESYSSFKDYCYSKGLVDESADADKRMLQIRLVGVNTPEIPHYDIQVMKKSDIVSMTLDEARKKNANIKKYTDSGLERNEDGKIDFYKVKNSSGGYSYHEIIGSGSKYVSNKKSGYVYKQIVSSDESEKSTLVGGYKAQENLTNLLSAGNIYFMLDANGIKANKTTSKYKLYYNHWWNVADADRPMV